MLVLKKKESQYDSLFSLTPIGLQCGTCLDTVSSSLWL